MDGNELGKLTTTFQAELASIDPVELYNGFRKKLEDRIHASDLSGVLQLYDNKGLPAFAASVLGLKGPAQLMEKVGGLLGHDHGKILREKLSELLPPIPISLPTSC